MPKSSFPSPARSLGSITPRRHRTRLSRSVGSPGRHTSMTTAVEKLKAGNRDSFVPSPLSKTVLNDNTDIEEPRRESWWKNVDKSRDIMEVFNERPVGTNNIVDEFDVEILSQEKKDNYSMDIPESSGSESIASIIVPQRKLFTQKENKLEKKYKQIIGTRESTTRNKEDDDKPFQPASTAGRKTLFGHSKQSKPIFPSALLNISPDKTLIGNKTKELAADVPPPRNLFGNRMGTKKKNMFTDFIVSESEDDIPDIQTRRFTFTKQPEPLPRKSSTSRRDTSPASSITTDIELDDWKHLPSSTMMEHQLEDATTPARRARLSKLIETRETINTNSTANKTRQSDKSISSKDVAPASPTTSARANEVGNTGVPIEIQVLLSPKNLTSSKNKSVTKPKNASHIEKDLNEPINRDVEGNTSGKSGIITRNKNASQVETVCEDPATNEIETVGNDVITGTNQVETNIIDNLTKTLNKTSDVHKIDNLTKTFNKTSDVHIIDNLTRTLNKTSKQLSKSNIEEDTDIDPKKIDNLTRTLNKTKNILSKSKIDETIKSTVETEKVDNLTRTLNKSNKPSKSNTNTTKQDALETELASIVGQEEELDEDNDEDINLIYEDDEPAIQKNHNEEGDFAKNIIATSSEEAQNKSKNISAANASANRTAQNKTAQMKEKTLVTETPMPRKSKSVMSRVINETLDTISSEEQLDIIPDDINEEAIFKPSQELRRSTEIPSIGQEKHGLDVEGDQLIAKNTDERVENKEFVEMKDREAGGLEKEHKIIQDEEHDGMEVYEPELVVNESESLIEDDDEQNNSQEEVERKGDNQESKPEDEIQKIGEESECQVVENEEENQSQELDESLEIDNEEHNRSHEIGESDEGHEEGDETENDEQDGVQEMEEELQDESQEVEEQQDESQEMEEGQQDESQEMEEEDNNEHEEIEEAEDESESREILDHNTSQVSTEIENQVDSDIPDTPNASHDTTGRHRKKEKSQSPENIRHASNTPVVSFVGSKGRNTSIRKTILKKNFSVRQSIVPPSESTDGGSSKNSTVEGSGWDSHRNERKTLRLTFGKDFTPRKSIQTMVMEKSAKRQTIIDDANMKLHEANSTELSMDYEGSNIVPEETQNDISLQTRKAKLDDYWQTFKKDTINEMAKIEDEIRQSLKRNKTKGDFMNYKIPSKLVIRQQPLKLQTAPKTKAAKRTLASLENLPPELIEDMKYKPPKRFRPSNAPWITNRLYNFLENKLKPKYDYKARVRAEKLVEMIYIFSRDLRRLKTATPSSVTDLKREMARLDVVKTHYEFYHFFNEFLPNEVRFKVVPDIVNNIPTPLNGVFSNILQPDDI